MPEIRIDPLTGLRAIVATDRAARPGGELTVAQPEPIDPATDPFAEGHEDQTPPELFALRPGGGAADGPGWTVRVVPNRYPALTAGAAEPEPDPHPGLFTALPARGAHEVIVNSPEPVSSLCDLPVEQVSSAVEVWRERMRAQEGAAYVHLCVNERPEAGATQPHTHAQLVALGFVPASVARERERFSAHAMRTMGANLLEDLVQEEVRRRDRIVAIDDDAVLTCPYASRHEYALMLTPRRRRERFEDDGPSAAALLHDALSRLRRRFGASPPLNLWIRTAPRDADRFCWRIDIVPRLTHDAGLELGTGMHMNTVAPERAAAELREA
ncbi:galactose-1-phosphate uridylyltransferase [soil metagenome]